jgi:hypothetical protein
MRGAGVKMPIDPGVRAEATGKDRRRPSARIQRAASIAAPDSRHLSYVIAVVSRLVMHDCRRNTYSSGDFIERKWRYIGPVTE